jgi:hypothetical protein
MTKYMSQTPPWEYLKQWAAESGFTDDGFGNPQCNEWDDLRRFAHKVASDEREKWISACQFVMSQKKPMTGAENLRAAHFSEAVAQVRMAVVYGDNVEVKGDTQ